MDAIRSCGLTALGFFVCFALAATSCAETSTNAAEKRGPLANGLTRDGTKWTLRTTGRAPRWCLHLDESKGTATSTQRQCAEGIFDKSRGFLAYSRTCEPGAATFLFGRAPQGATDVVDARSRGVTARAIKAPKSVGGSSPLVVIVLDPAPERRIIVGYRFSKPGRRTFVGDLTFDCPSGTTAFGVLDLKPQNSQ